MPDREPVDEYTGFAAEQFLQATEPHQGVDDIALFAIDPVWTWHRYLLNGGRIMDVRSPYAANSTERGLVLKEAQRLWGGKKDEWSIQGVAWLDRDDA